MSPYGSVVNSAAGAWLRCEFVCSRLRQDLFERLREPTVSDEISRRLARDERRIEEGEGFGKGEFGGWSVHISCGCLDVKTNTGKRRVLTCH